MKSFIKKIITGVVDVFNKTISYKNIRYLKAKTDWATEVDLKIKNFIIQNIKKTFLSDFILSEESYSSMPKKIPSRLWFVDPLDGTTNLSFGLPHYGISIAFYENLQPKYAFVYDLVNRQIFWAEKGKGAYRDNIRLKIKDRSMKGNLIGIGCPYGFVNFKKTMAPINKIHKTGARLVLIGSSVIAATYTALNTLAAYFEYGLKPWDVAATLLIIKEAGGAVEDIKGDFDPLNFKVFIGGSSTAVKEILQFINKS